LNAPDSSALVIAWWAALSFIGVVNIAAWTRIAVTDARRSSGETLAERRDRHRQLVFSALFVFGCAYRSFLPRSEGSRICLYPSLWSSAMLGRAAATVAELSLTAQWTLVVEKWSRQCRLAAGIVVARLLIPLIVFAEICSWYTAITTNFIGSVIEESTWAVSAMLVTATLIALWVRNPSARRRFLATSIALNAAYIVFMWTIDVPMYVGRARADAAIGRPFVSLARGLRDSALRFLVTRRFEDWRPEIPWMTLYFSAGVWVSLALIHAPRLDASASQSIADSSAQ
jgi:hypothetical protein